MNETPPPDAEPGRKRDLAGMLGWGVLLVVAAAFLLMRLLGGSGGC